MLYLVACRLSEAETRERVNEYLQTISQTHWHHFDGVWFVKSDMKAVELRNRIASLTKRGDQVVVALLSGFAAWRGIDDPYIENWLLKNL